MMKTTLAILFSLFVSASAMAVPIVDPWTISGPGTTSATDSGGGVWDLSYNLNNGSLLETWTVTSGPVTAAGDYEFEWAYSGLHSVFELEAFLFTSTGTQLVNTSLPFADPSGFYFSGSYTFVGVSQGDTIGFELGGSHMPSGALQGNLHLEQ